jgi:DNA helicase HerA-like ATPase
MDRARRGLADRSDGPSTAPAAVRPVRPRRPAPAGGVDATIRRGDRVTIFGKTGSGKSVLARAIIRSYSRAILADPKGRATVDDWPIVYGSSAFVAAWPATPRIVVRLGPGEDRRKWLDAIAWHVYRHGETAFVLDETIGVVDANRGSAGLDALLSQGRELGITGVVCTQRPSRIPPAIISEADHLFVFRLNRREDRETVADTIGPYSTLPTPHAFSYWCEALTRAVDCAPLERAR